MISFDDYVTQKSLCLLMNSSGTSQGRPKFVPFTDELMENTLQLFRTAFAFRNRYTGHVPHILTPFYVSIHLHEDTENNY